MIRNHCAAYHANPLSCFFPTTWAMKVTVENCFRAGFTTLVMLLLLHTSRYEHTTVVTRTIRNRSIWVPSTCSPARSLCRNLLGALLLLQTSFGKRAGEESKIRRRMYSSTVLPSSIYPIGAPYSVYLPIHRYGGITSCGLAVPSSPCMMQTTPSPSPAGANGREPSYHHIVMSTRSLPLEGIK